jgi:hypothetical protein
MFSYLYYFYDMLAITFAALLLSGIVGDVSQYGNWSSFRNEMMADERVEISTKMFTPMPRAGKLHFDFASTERVPDDAVLLPDAKFLKVLTNLCLIDGPEDVSAMARLTIMKKEAKKTLGGTGITVYEATIDNAMQTALDLTAFYDELIDRDVLYNEASKAEEVKVSLNRDPSSRGSSRPVSKASSRPGSKNAGHPLDKNKDRDKDRDKDREAEKPMMHRSASMPMPAHYSDTAPAPISAELDGLFNTAHLEKETGAPDLRNVGGPPPEGLSKSLSMPPLLPSPPLTASGNRDIMKSALREMLESEEVSPEAKGFRIVEASEELLGPTFIRARHLALLIEKFPEECCVDKVPLFATYRVDVIISLFSRVRDLHNFELVLRLMKPHELAYLYARLGRLMLFNPSKPEGALELNMALYEERQIAKILVVLSVIEPGDNFIGPKFRWDRESPFIPGWDVTQPWTTEDGLSKKGFFSVQYYAGQGKGKAGCKADTLWRRCLMQLTAVKETDVIDEDDEASVPRAERPRLGEELMLGSAKGVYVMLYSYTVMLYSYIISCCCCCQFFDDNSYSM